jgi:hypothetical protein
MKASLTNLISVMDVQYIKVYVSCSADIGSLLNEGILNKAA